jgi:Tol biopolymer transport system component
LEIWVCDHDGANPIQLSSFGKATNGGLHWAPESWRPHWAPDSHRIVFVSNASGKSELYIVDVDSRQQRRLETGTPDASGPYWSANGRWIYFNTQEPGAVWKVPVEGGDPVRLTKDGRVDPQESTDGKRVFYVVPKRAEQSEEVWSVSVDGGDERLETRMTVNASWAPSQSGIYFLDGSDVGLGRGRLRFFDFTTRRFQNLAELEPGAVFPGDISVSRDGRTIFYSEIDQRVGDIMLVEGFR